MPTVIKVLNAKYIRETPKAYLIEVELVGGGPRAKCWFPKSLSCFEDDDTSKDFYAKEFMMSMKNAHLGDYILTGAKQ